MIRSWETEPDIYHKDMGTFRWSSGVDLKYSHSRHSPLQWQTIMESIKVEMYLFDLPIFVFLCSKHTLTTYLIKLGLQSSFFNNFSKNFHNIKPPLLPPKDWYWIFFFREWLSSVWLLLFKSWRTDRQNGLHLLNNRNEITFLLTAQWLDCLL